MEGDRKLNCVATIMTGTEMQHTDSHNAKPIHFTSCHSVTFSYITTNHHICSFSNNIYNFTIPLWKDYTQNTRNSCSKVHRAENRLFFPILFICQLPHKARKDLVLLKKRRNVHLFKGLAIKYSIVFSFPTN